MAGEELPYYLEEAENRNRRFNREYDDPLHLKYPKYEYKPDNAQVPEPDQELTLINQDRQPPYRVSVPQQISSSGHSYPVQYVYQRGREYYVPPSPPALLLQQPGTGREYYVLSGTPPGPYSSGKQVVTLQDGQQYLVPASENSSTNRMVATLPNGQHYFVPEQSLYAASSGSAHHILHNKPSEAVFYLNSDPKTKRGTETRRLPIKPSGPLTINSTLRPQRSAPFADGHPIRMITAETQLFQTAGSSDPRTLPSQTAIKRRAPQLLPQNVGTSDIIIPSSRGSSPDLIRPFEPELYQTIGSDAPLLRSSSPAVRHSDRRSKMSASPMGWRVEPGGPGPSRSTRPREFPLPVSSPAPPSATTSPTVLSHRVQSPRGITNEEYVAGLDLRNQTVYPRGYQGPVFMFA